MSDETGVATAPPVEAPLAVTPDVQPVTETPAAEPEEISFEPGNSKAERRRNAIKRGKQRTLAEAAKERAAQQPRVEAGAEGGGRFKSEAAEPAPTAEETPAAELAPSVEGSTVDTTAQADAAPAGDTVDIPLPEGHPLRDRGKTSIRALKSEEAEIRNGVNAAVRARRLEEQLEQAQRDKALMEARQKVLSGDFVKYETDPKYTALFEQIREAPGFGDDVAETVLAGLKALEQQKLQDAERGADQQLGIMRTTQQFVGEVEVRAQEVLGVWAENNELSLRMPQLIQRYLSAVDRRNEREGHVTNPSINEFFTYISPEYRKDPRVGAAIERVKSEDTERMRARIREEVRADMEREAQEKARERETRHGARPPTERYMPARPSTPATETEPDTVPAVTGTQRKKELRQRARERGQGYAR